MMEKMSVERSIRLDAPRERVWQAMTTPEEIVGWLVPNLPGAMMKRSETGTVTIFLGEMGVDFMTLEVVEAGRQAVIRALPDMLLSTTWTLADDGAGTQVTASTGGFDLLPENARQDRTEYIGRGWEQTLQNLQAAIAGAALPYPAAYVSSLFGFWRDVRKTLTIERSIWMKAPRERVWRAITDPVKIQAWMSPTIAWTLTALEVGGRFFVHDAETNAEKYVQVIELLDPPYQLLTRTVPEPPDTVVKHTQYTLVEENGGTRLMLTYWGYEPQAAGAHWREIEENTFGFGMMLRNIKADVEGQPLPFPGGY
jgi:uncharacterized protein YndB with AHSA1/START domain